MISKKEQIYKKQNQFQKKNKLIDRINNQNKTKHDKNNREYKKQRQD